MTVRPPRAIAPKLANIWTDNSTALDYEIAQEKASTLGRLGRALEAALAALRDFDAQSNDPAEAKPARRALVANASQALWHFVVQREALGLRDSRQVMRDYRVPSEVQSRMGALPANPASRPPRG
jgi:hypothetical protein